MKIVHYTQVSETDFSIWHNFIKPPAALITNEFKGRIVSKFDLDLLNLYKLMYFDKNTNGNKNGKSFEGNKWVLFKQRWIPLSLGLIWLFKNIEIPI